VIVFPPLFFPGGRPQPGATPPHLEGPVFFFEQSPFSFHAGGPGFFLPPGGESLSLFSFFFSSRKKEVEIRFSLYLVKGIKSSPYTSYLKGACRRNLFPFFLMPHPFSFFPFSFFTPRVDGSFLFPPAKRRPCVFKAEASVGRGRSFFFFSSSGTNGGSLIVFPKLEKKVLLFFFFLPSLQGERVPPFSLGKQKRMMTRLFLDGGEVPLFL